jgi:hypothetical protein
MRYSKLELGEGLSSRKSAVWPGTVAMGRRKKPLPHREIGRSQSPAFSAAILATTDQSQPP